MPSERAILLGLLRFGALSAAEKVRALDEYQAHSDSVGGGAHVDEPGWEVIWSLRIYTKPNDDITDTGIRRVLSRVHELSDRLLQDEILSSAWDDRTISPCPLVWSWRPLAKQRLSVWLRRMLNICHFGI